MQRIKSIIVILTTTTCMIVGAETLAVQSGSIKGDTDSTWRVSHRTVEFLPGIIVDSHQGVLYAMSPHGGIDAVEITSGKLLWNTNRAAKPLLLIDEYLIAQQEPGPQSQELVIVMLNTTHVGTGVSEFTIPTPPGVHAFLDDQLGSSFRVTAQWRDDNVIIFWESRKQSMHHLATAIDNQPGISKYSGIAKINLQNGEVHQLQPQALPANHDEPMPKSISKLIKTGKLQRPPWRIGNVFAAISRMGSEQSQVILKRWHHKTGLALPDVNLFDDARLLRERSVDGRHIIASKRVTPQGNADSAYSWIIFSLETGKKVAELTNPSPSGRFLISGPTLLEMRSRSKTLTHGKWVDDPLRLRATSIDTGNLRWERPIRDITYRGPYPPGQQ